MAGEVVLRAWLLLDEEGAGDQAGEDGVSLVLLADEEDEDDEGV